MPLSCLMDSWNNRVPGMEISSQAELFYSPVIWREKLEEELGLYLAGTQIIF